jgi:uncharacterized protein with FMN-binding domain
MSTDKTPDPAGEISGRTQDDSRAVLWSSSNLVALGSAAVLTVYGAGYMKTQAAAQRFAEEDAARSRPRPSQLVAVSQAAEPAPVVDTTVVRGVVQPRTNAAVSSNEADSSRSKAPLVAEPATVAAPAAMKGAASEPAPGPAVPAVTPERAVAAPAKVDSVAVAAAQRADSVEKAKPQLRDGSYMGYGTSRHGDVEATIEIKGGRIVFAFISRCLTQYPCSLMDHLLPQVLARQSIEVDYVSGATQSVNALYYALGEALQKAK